MGSSGSVIDAAGSASDEEVSLALKTLFQADPSRAERLVETSRAAAAVPAPKRRGSAGEDFAQELLAEHNLARERPQEYAETRVAPHLRLYDGLQVRHPGSNRVLVTKEGAAACEELYQALLTAPPRKPLRLERGLCLAANSHAFDLAAQDDAAAADSEEEPGPGGDSLGERVERFGEWWGCLGENLSFGFREPADAVLWLLIDDGDPKRSHRGNILDEAFEHLGCARAAGKPAADDAQDLLDIVVAIYTAGFGPSRKTLQMPLQAEAQGTMNDNVRAILNSLPHSLQNLAAECEALLAKPDGPKLKLDYRPGNLQVQTVTEVGSKTITRTQHASWAVRNVAAHPADGEPS